MQKSPLPFFSSIANQLRYGTIAYVLINLIVITIVLIVSIFSLRQQAIRSIQNERSMVLQNQIDDEIRHMVEHLESTVRANGLAAGDQGFQALSLIQMPTHFPESASLAVLNTAEQIVATNPNSAAVVAAFEALLAAEQLPRQAANRIVTLGAISTQNQLLMAEPILDADGGNQGWLILKVDLTFLQPLLSEAKTELGYAYLVDRENNAIVYTQEGQLLLSELETHPTVADLQSGIGTPLSSWRYFPALFTTYRGLFGERVLRTATAVAGPGWDLVLEYPIQAVYAPIINLLWLTGFVLLLAATGAILIGVLLTREIITPLTQLTNAAHELSQGNLNIHLSDFRRNELGLLAATFNQMVAQLQATVTNLEQGVKERTSILNRRSLQIQAAAETARDATSAYQLTELINRAVNLVPSRFGYYHAGIFLVDEEGEYAILQAATGPIGRQMLSHQHKLKIGEEGIVGRVIHTGQAYITPDVRQDHVYWHNPLLPNTRSEMGLPLKVGKRVIGAMNVQSREVAAFDEEDIIVLQILTDQLAVAIEKTRLFEKMQAMLTERLRTIIANVPLILFSLNREGVITLAEGKGLALLGTDNNSYTGQSVWQVFARRPEILNAMRRALAGEAVVTTATVRNLTWDVQYIPLNDGDNKVTSVTGVAVDITQRLQAEESLREKEAQLRQIIDLVPHMIFARDSNGRLLLVNRTMAEAYNMEVDTLTGTDSRESHPVAAELERFLADDQEVIRTRQPKSIREETFTDASGRQRTLQTSKIPMAWSGTEETAVLGVAVDITEQKQAEEALRQAQKLESLGVLAGGVAHDFNNLLVAILGQTSLAQLRLPPESPARTAVEKAAKAAERAADLTRQLLAYSGRGHFEIHPLNFNMLIQENLHLFEVAVPKQVQLRSNLSDPLPLIEGDAGQMQQIIMNLILNGAEAIGDAPGTVTVTTGTQIVTQEDSHLWQHTGEPLQPGTYVTLEVEDTGRGMEQATLRRIFDPFFSTKKSGRGLGLAAVLGIVRGHQGGIRVHSKSGKGTTFKVLFPSVKSEQIGTSVEEPSRGTAVQTGTILIIDDEDSVRETAADILAGENFSVLTAVDGQSGLDIYREHLDDIQVILLDLSMHGLSGEETFHELHKLNAEVRIILSSGYNAVDAMRRFPGEGLAGFLQKPYSAHRLLEAVRQQIVPN